MFAFTTRRITQAFIVIFVISLLGFSMQKYFGDPIQNILGVSVSLEERERLRQELGLDRSLFFQYRIFLERAFQGNIGQSFFYKKPALEVILSKAPATIELVFVAALITILLSTPIGVLIALSPKNWISKFLMGISLFGISVPVFLTGIFLIYFFSVQYHWLPSFGRGETVQLWGGWETGLLTFDGWKHILMPSLALVSILLPLFIRLIRSEMLEVLQSEYIKFAWAKGLRRRRIWFLHALKNTLMPVVTVGGVQLGVMLAYTIVTETVFHWHGLGFLFLEAVERADNSLLVAYLMCVGFLFVATNTVVDLIYGLLNPRIRISGKK